YQIEVYDGNSWNQIHETGDFLQNYQIISSRSQNKAYIITGENELLDTDGSTVGSEVVSLPADCSNCYGQIDSDGTLYLSNYDYQNPVPKIWRVELDNSFTELSSTVGAITKVYTIAAGDEVLADVVISGSRRLLKLSGDDFVSFLPASVDYTSEDAAFSIDQ